MQQVMSLSRSRIMVSVVAACALMAWGVGRAQAVFTITEMPGYDIVWDGTDGAHYTTADPAPAPLSGNVAHVSNGATAFGTSAYPAPAHSIAHANDGLYGNSNSWLADPGDPAPYIGVDFGALKSLNNVAWGRDNGNSTTEPQFTDRSTGAYTLQRTTVISPGTGTPFTGSAATGWETIGTLTYSSADDAVVGGGFTPWLRHQYGLSYNGNPVAATGLRILVSSNAMDIDEIEAYEGPGIVDPLTLAETGGTFGPNNVAGQSAGATAFANTVLSGFPAHSIDHLNDETYGNSNSWIGNEPSPNIVGIQFAASEYIDSIAFGRDNGGEAQQFVDRTNGSYILQYTNVASPGLGTPDGDWTTIGALNYDGSTAPDGTPYLRHRYTFDPVNATGIRLVVAPNGIGGGIAIDEIEAYAVPEPASATLVLLAGLMGLGTRRRWRR
jgi:PEP-CTERM motif